MVPSDEAAGSFLYTLRYSHDGGGENGGDESCEAHFVLTRGRRTYLCFFPLFFSYVVEIIKV